MSASINHESSKFDTDFEEHSSCFLPELNWLEGLFSQIEFGDLNAKAPTNQVKNFVMQTFLDHGWKSHVLTDQRLPDELSLANYIVDFQKIFSHSGCDHKHQIVLELAFDNRQSIGTNFLKVDFANRMFKTSQERVSVSVLAVLKHSAKILGRWDGSSGTFDEYSLASRRVYSDVIKTTVLLLALS